MDFNCPKAENHRMDPSLWSASSARLGSIGRLHERPKTSSRDRDSCRSSTVSSGSTVENNFTHENHSKLVLQKMEKYLNSGKLTDVTLIAAGKHIEAHRIVLSASSDYFAAMFTSDFGESFQSEVEIQAVDPSALEALVNYCYTGHIQMEEDNVETLLATACLLQLPEVVEACCSFLVKQLHPSNCLGIRLFADSQGCKQLMDIANAFIEEHFVDVIGNQEFVLLPGDEVARILSCDDLNIPNEELMFQALMLWLRHDLPNRKKDLPRLLSLIKLPLLTPQFIADHVESNPIFKEDRLCQDLIVEALKYHLLPERRSALQSSRTRPRKATAGTVYIFGGLDASTKVSATVDKYDWRGNSWTVAGSMTVRRLQFGIAVLDGKVFVVGGRDGLKTLNTVECWDARFKTWTSMQPMGTHRHGLGVATLEGPIYAVGGHDGWSYLNSVERWDPITRQWTYVASMNCQRSSVGVAALNGKLYAVGGRDGSSCLRTVECYDPHTNRWNFVAPMVRRRGGAGVATAHGYLYAFGGFDSPACNHSASRFDCVERYDPTTDTWTIVSSMSVGRDAPGVALLGDRLFVVGGYDGQTHLNLVESYDPLTNEWQQMSPLPSGRAGACVAVVKNSSIIP